MNSETMHVYKYIIKEANICICIHKATVAWWLLLKKSDSVTKVQILCLQYYVFKYYVMLFAILCFQIRCDAVCNTIFSNTMWCCFQILCLQYYVFKYYVMLFAIFFTLWKGRNKFFSCTAMGKIVWLGFIGHQSL